MQFAVTKSFQSRCHNFLELSSDATVILCLRVIQARNLRKSTSCRDFMYSKVNKSNGYLLDSSSILICNTTFALT